MVKDAAGEAVAGAFVKAKNGERRLTFLAISQDQGRYRLTDLPPGKYKVQGIGGGFQSDSPAAVELAEGQEVSANLTLDGRQPDMPKPLAPSDLEGMLPEGPGKMLVKSRCTTCHGLEQPIRHRGSWDHWEHVVTAMLGARTLSAQDRDTLVSYLTNNFGEDKPSLIPEPLQASHLSKTGVKGVAAKYRVMEYALPAGVAPHDQTADSEGIAWVSERLGNHLGRFDPQTLTYTRIPLPESEAGAMMTAIEVDAQGHVWVIDGGPNNRLLRYDPKTQKFTVYPGPGGSFNTIRFLPDGSVWGSNLTGNKVVKLDPATGKFTNYVVPSGVQAKKSMRPYGMAVDGNGKLWFAEEGSNKVGKLDPKTGEIGEFVLPVAEDARPKRMSTDSQGNVWMGIWLANKLVKIDHRTDKFTYFTPPTNNSGPYSVSVDTRRNLVWFSEQMADKLARFDPRTNTFVEYTLPTLNSNVRRIQVDPSRPNRVWFSGGGISYDKLGYVEALD
ncbi:MAG: hypothetical protein A3J28_15900 [Acidobacteria bacterium RIFCSPLOWO2_12_FULL_60_22]|nr:MAG: hypothetical protein A3J28_15900 [Acidobacteria bacterium RIFCSPLOWO2_12_FULL_60_22]